MDPRLSKGYVSTVYVLASKVRGGVASLASADMGTVEKVVAR